MAPRASQLAKDLIDFMGTLRISQGREAGNLMKLMPWQRRWLRGAFSQPDSCALTVARGAGKTTLTAATAVAALHGPLAEPRSEILVVASSFDQGLICFRHVMAFLEPEIQKDPKRWRIQDSANRATIQDNTTGVILRVLGSDSRRLMGAAPKLVIGDELSAWPETQIDRMLAALSTAMGKIPGSKALWIGTRASLPDHPFEQLLFGGQVGYSQVHAMSKDHPPLKERHWKIANPGWEYQPDLRVALRQEAARAKSNPAALQAFKSLRCNMGVPSEVEDTLVRWEDWERVERTEIERSGPLVLGVDLGQSASMSALAGYWPESGAADVLCFFPRKPDLINRGRADGVEDLYLRCAEDGDLMVAGEFTTDVGELLSEGLRRWGRPEMVVCDTWRMADLKEALSAIDFPLAHLVLRRQGWIDGTADCRDFRRALFEGKLYPRKSLLLRSAMSGARVETNSPGDQKMTKGGGGRRRRCRDDAAAALVLAVAEGSRRQRRLETKRQFKHVVLG